tara:strand:+ start:335 stop:643 length:309 start_codon:yes stop_codon:yes gene_type:complete
MSIDLKTKEGRKNYLKDNLDDLLSNINESYGPVLLEELQKRLEYTIDEFNNEINEAFSLLKARDDNRKAIYSEYKENSNDESLESETAWEKKLKEIENKKNK